MVIRNRADIVGEEGVHGTPFLPFVAPCLEYDVSSPAIHGNSSRLLRDVPLLPPDIEPHVLLIAHEVGALNILCQVKALDDPALVIHVKNVLFIAQTEIRSVGFVS